MFEKAKSRLAALFAEAAEAQKQIDDSARKVVEGIVRMIDVGSDEARSSRDALAGRDFSWHDGIAEFLAREGFQAPQAFEPRSFMTRPIESRTLVEYSLGDGGAILAMWFALAATATRGEKRFLSFFTLFEDGISFDTEAPAGGSLLPNMDTERDEKFPEGTPPEVMLARQRAWIAAHGAAPHRFASLDEYFASRQERQERRTAFRRGLGLSLVEQYVTARFTGDKADVGQAYLESIRKHPEWYKYANGNAGNEGGVKDKPADSPQPNAESSGGPAAPMMPLNFMMSATDDGRRTISTFGMLFSTLPELLMTEVAANHCRAGRVLMGTVARGIVRSRDNSTDSATFMANLVSDAGARITLTREDAVAAGVTDGTATGASPVVVGILLRGFTTADEPSMLHLNPLPDDARPQDERLREACARLGVDVPAAQDAQSADNAMREAHERSVARAAEVRARWVNREAAGEKVLVKYRATMGDHGEYVWMEVRDWRDDAIEGHVVTPAPRVGLSLAAPVTIASFQLYDQLVTGASGAIVPALTDVVATDYGMDI